jgi:hypothetical protein
MGERRSGITPVGGLGRGNPAMITEASPGRNNLDIIVER